MKFVCEGEDQEITKTGSKKWKVREESVHFIMEARQQKIEKNETESPVSMHGTRLYWQSFEERLRLDTRTGWMTGCCTAKNSCTAWVRGCRRTSWKTWGRKTKYSGTNTITDKDKMHGKQKQSHELSQEKQLAVCL